MLSPLSHAGMTGVAGIEPASPESESGVFTSIQNASVDAGTRTPTLRVVAARSIQRNVLCFFLAHTDTKSSQSESNAHLLGCSQPSCLWTMGTKIVMEGIEPSLSAYQTDFLPLKDITAQLLGLEPRHQGNAPITQRLAISCLTS